MIPQSSSYENPRSSSYPQPRSPNYPQPRSSSYPQPRSSSYPQPRSSSYPQPRSSSYPSLSSWTSDPWSNSWTAQSVPSDFVYKHNIKDYVNPAYNQPGDLPQQEYIDLNFNYRQ